MFQGSCLCQDGCDDINILPETTNFDGHNVQVFDCGGEQQIIRHQHIVKHRRDIINEYDVCHEYDINHYDVVRHRDVVRTNDFTTHRPNYCGESCGCGRCNLCNPRPMPRRARMRRRFW